MPQFRKKPVVIEARQFDGVNYTELSEWSDSRVWCWDAGDKIAKIATLEGIMTARVGDWIIKGVANEFYPCKPDIFEATYEPVTS